MPFVKNPSKPLPSLDYSADQKVIIQEKHESVVVLEKEYLDIEILLFWAYIIIIFIPICLFIISIFKRIFFPKWDNKLKLINVREDIVHDDEGSQLKKSKIISYVVKLFLQLGVITIIFLLLYNFHDVIRDIRNERFQYVFTFIIKLLMAFLFLIGLPSFIRIVTSRNLAFKECINNSIDEFLLISQSLAAFALKYCIQCAALVYLYRVFFRH